MKETYRLRHASENDLEAMKNILKSCGLSALGIESSKNTFILVEKNEAIIGMLGSICLGEQALLRSFAVEKQYRGRALGRLMLEEMEIKLREKGIKEIFLLTETAADYFSKIGFEEISRGQIPQRLLQISELDRVCSCKRRCFHRMNY